MAVEFSGSVNRGKLLPHGVFASLDLSWSAQVNHETKAHTSSVVKTNAQKVEVSMEK